MQFLLRSTVYSSRLTHVGVTTALLVFGQPALAEERKADYHVNLHGSPHIRNCNESWFRSRFELIRGRERFQNPTYIDLAVMNDGKSGFLLDIFLRSSVNGPSFNSVRLNYDSPIECSRVVADAAEMTLEMMRGHPPRPMKVAESKSYSVEMSATDDLLACRDKDEWSKFFGVYRADHQFWGPFPKGIELVFDRNADKRIFVKVVLREPNGLPMRDKTGQRLDDIRLGPYAEGTECTQALAYSAQTVATLLEDLPRPWPRVEPVRTPAVVPKRALEFGTGFVMLGGYVGDAVQMGLHTHLEIPFLTSKSLLARLQITDPYDWKRNDGLAVGSVNIFVLAGIGVCQNWKYGGGCAEIRAGRTELDTFRLAQIRKSETFWPVSIGPNLYVHTGPHLGIIKLRLDGGFGLNPFPIGVRARSDVLVDLGIFSWSIHGSLTIPLAEVSTAK